MTGPLLFNNPQKRSDWLKLANAVAEVGVDHLPCAQAPDLFYPDGDEGGAAYYVKMAKTACQPCPLLKMCGTYALRHNEEYGVWGGMSPTERKNIRRNARG